jgi:hypothetical protein
MPHEVALITTIAAAFGLARPLGPSVAVLEQIGEPW